MARLLLLRCVRVGNIDATHVTLPLYQFHTPERVDFMMLQHISVGRQASLGKLRRNDALSCIIWKSVISEKTCCFILPDNLGGKHDDNRSMNKGIEIVKQYGFNHIIIIGCDHMEFLLWLCIRLGWYEWFIMATLGLFQGGGILRLTDSPEKQRNDFLISVKGRYYEWVLLLLGDEKVYLYTATREGGVKREVFCPNLM
ncbi:hypothetical protein RhiirC2_710063 [Rhizophagus irregularis]|uniref:Uncharacterized protein n=1 Tax=Rhizophagus irregularis TaxID=588596 RepID=A0A2N1NG10_9GLOM|nr:hypothetical protein RhiirC2_710063 [Rhizophagus irregularis]